MTSRTEALQARWRAAAGSAGQFGEDGQAWAGSAGAPAGRQFAERVGAGMGLSPTAGLNSLLNGAAFPGGGGGRPATFAPGQQFPASDVGAYWDFSNTSTMFQDVAGATPAVAGSSVALVRDLSGNGHDLVQAAAAARPKLLDDGSGSRLGLSFDGVGQFLSIASFDLSAASAISTTFGVLTDTPAGKGILFEHSASVEANPGTFAFGTNTTDGSTVGGRFLAAGTQLVRSTPFTIPVPYRRVFSGVAKTSTDFIFRVNGSVVQSIVPALGTGPWGSYPFYVGCRGGASDFYKGFLFSLYVRAVLATPAELDSTELWVNDRTGA